MDETVKTSRRGLLQVIGLAPIAAAVPPIRSSWAAALEPLHVAYDDDPASPLRSPEGRRLSRTRYHTAEQFFPGPDRPNGDWHLFLYRAGITAQLGIASHLLDVGFPDEWCARHIGLRVSKSLQYANATGFAHDDPEMSRLAAVLTPYWKWNSPQFSGDRQLSDGGFTRDQVNSLLRGLLDHVRHVTGHPRPQGWQKRQTGEAAT